MNGNATSCRPASNSRYDLGFGALRRENIRFRGTGGVSEHNGALGFRPAFQDLNTGNVYLARYADGTLAPCHLLDGLPSQLVQSRDSRGRVTQAIAGIVSGFVMDGRFYTRQQAADYAARC